MPIWFIKAQHQKSQTNLAKSFFTGLYISRNVTVFVWACLIQVLSTTKETCFASAVETLQQIRFVLFSNYCCSGT